MKIYLSGKITGIEEEAFAQFEAEELDLISKGMEVVNPFKLPHNHGKTHAEYLREDIKALCECDAIVMLKGWHFSVGANLEHTIAKAINLEIYYQ